MSRVEFWRGGPRGYEIYEDLEYNEVSPSHVFIIHQSQAFPVSCLTVKLAADFVLSGAIIFHVSV